MKFIALLLATAGVCIVLGSERAGATEALAPEAKSKFEPPQKFRTYTTRRGLTGMAQRALAARFAIRDRLLADSLAARAFPPLSPPRRPSATAAGFLSGWASASPVT